MAIEQLLVDTFDLQAIYFDIRNRMASLYQKPATGIPASDLAEGVIPDISGKADKTDTVLLSTLSCNRIPGTDVGANSIAFGIGVSATGQQSQAFGAGNTASGAQSHVEGGGNAAYGPQSHVEGGGNTAYGPQSHVEGAGNTVIGASSHVEGAGNYSSGGVSHVEGSGNNVYADLSHVEGFNNISNAINSHIFGKYNVDPGCRDWPEWVPGEHCYPGDLRKITNNGVSHGIKCLAEHTDSTFVLDHWEITDVGYTYIEMVGNGTADGARSNARALDWNGNEYLKGKLFILCNGDSTGGQEVVTKSEIDGLGLTVENGKLCITVEDDTEEEEE